MPPGSLPVDPDGGWLDIPWESPADAARRVLEGFFLDPLCEGTFVLVRERLDEAGVGYRRVFGEVPGRGPAVLGVVLEDGTEVRFP